MAEVNTSMYPTGGQQNNPLTTTATAVGIANAAQQNKLMQVQEQSNRLAIANSHFSNIAAYFGSLAAKVDANGNPTVSKKDFINRGVEGINNGLFTPSEYATVMANMPKTDDSKALQDYAHSYQLRAMDALTQTNQSYGTPTTMPRFKNGHYGTAVGIIKPAAQGGGFIEAGDESQSAPNSNTNAPTNPSPGETIGNLGVKNDNDGASPGFIPSSPRLGSEAAYNITAQDSAKQGQELNRVADTIPAQKALLSEMDAKLDKFNSGPGSNDVRAMVAAFNRISPVPIDTEGVAGNEVFNKLSTTLAQQQFQALGGTGTDDKLASAVSTNPNAFLSNMGNKQVIALLKGNADAIAAKNKEWVNWQKQNGPDTYPQFSTEFNQTYDPRAFQIRYLAPKDVKALVADMDAAEKKQFSDSVEYAAKKGWIPNKRPK